MSLVIADSRPESLTLIAAQHEDWIIRQAITLLENRVFKAGPALGSPAAVRDYLRLKLVAEPNEIFAVVFLDNQHQCSPSSRCSRARSTRLRCIRGWWSSVRWRSTLRR